MGHVYTHINIYIFTLHHWYQLCHQITKHTIFIEWLSNVMEFKTVNLSKDPVSELLTGVQVILTYSCHRVDQTCSL